MHKLPAQCRWGVVFCAFLRGCENKSFFGTISSDSGLQELAIQKFINCKLTRASFDVFLDKEFMLQSNELRIIDGRLTIALVSQLTFLLIIGEITLILFR